MPTKKRSRWGAGSVRQEKSGKWSVRWPVDGQRMFRGGFPNEAAAQEALAILMGQRSLRRMMSLANVDGRPPAPPGWEWAAGRWHRMGSREKQAVIFAKGNGLCAYCGHEVIIPSNSANRNHPLRAVMDHRIPVASGGSSSMENLVLACHSCNMTKGDRDHEAGPPRARRVDPSP